MARQNGVRVLAIVEDGERAATLKRLLGEDPEARLSVSRCANMDAALKRVAEGAVDALLLDLESPDGAASLERLREACPELPIVVLTEPRHESEGLDAVRQGAQDYLLWGRTGGTLMRLAIAKAVERRRCMLRQVGRIERAGAAREPQPERAEPRGAAPNAMMKTGSSSNGGWRPEEANSLMLGMVSHELRTPLTIIKGAIDCIQSAAPDRLTRPEKTLLDLAHANIGRVVKLVENLLELSRLESGQAIVHLSPVDGAKLLGDAALGAGVAAKKREVAVELDLPQGLPSLYADADLVAEVLSNLVDNACRFARKKVVLRASVRRPSSVATPNGGQAGPSTHSNAVQISVIDDGAGVPKQRIKELFNKFAQLARARGGNGYKGTGLGLAICKEIVERLGGTIWAESDSDGTRFHFILPAYAGDAASRPSVQSRVDGARA